MIAVIGKIGVGKTTFLKNLGIDNSKIFFADEFVAKNYLLGSKLCQKIKEEIGDFLLDSNGVSKTKIKEWISQNIDNLERLEKIVYQEIFTTLKNGKYELAELPNLSNKYCDFLSLISVILCLSNNPKKRQKNLVKRNVDKSTILLIDAKNDPKSIKKSLFSLKPIVDIYINNCESLEQNQKILKLVKSIL